MYIEALNKSKEKLDGGYFESIVKAINELKEQSWYDDCVYLKIDKKVVRL